MFCSNCGHSFEGNTSNVCRNCGTIKIPSQNQNNLTNQGSFNSNPLIHESQPPQPQDGPNGGYRAPAHAMPLGHSTQPSRSGQINSHSTPGHGGQFGHSTQPGHGGQFSHGPHPGHRPHPGHIAHPGHRPHPGHSPYPGGHGPHPSFGRYPGYGPPAAFQPGRGKAIGSLILGIFSVMFPLPFIGVILGIVGLVLASTAKREGYIGGVRTAGFVISIIGTIAAVSYTIGILSIL